MAQPAGLQLTPSSSLIPVPNPTPPTHPPAGNYGIRLSDKGLAVAPMGGWGSLRYAENAAFLQAVLASAEPDGAKRAAQLQFVRRQVDYALGSR